MAEPIAPIVNSLSAPFWDAAGEGRLVLPHCLATDRAFWPPSPTSPFVTAGAVEWRPAEPKGVLRSRVVYRRTFQKILEARPPYAIGLVELRSRVRLQAHIADPDADDAPKAGDAVTLHFAPLVEGNPPVLHATRAEHDDLSA